MKKIVALLMVLVLALGLCACGNGQSSLEATQPTENGMKKELKTGTWSRDFTALGVRCQEAYSFKNGGEFVEASLIGNNPGTAKGTYVVTDTTIELTYEAGDTKSIYYTYEDGHLELTMRSSTGNEWQLVHNQ